MEAEVDARVAYKAYVGTQMRLTTTACPLCFLGAERVQPSFVRKGAKATSSGGASRRQAWKKRRRLSLGDRRSFFSLVGIKKNTLVSRNAIWFSLKKERTVKSIYRGQEK